MDLLINENSRDLEVNDQGFPISAYGIDEAAQRAALILTTKKGSFIYDRDFGIDLGASGDTSADGDKYLMLIGREALCGMTETELLDIDYSSWSNYVTLEFKIGFEDETKSMEVTYRDDI